MSCSGTITAIHQDCHNANVKNSVRGVGVGHSSRSVWRRKRTQQNRHWLHRDEMRLRAKGKRSENENESFVSTSKPSGAIREAHVRTCATSTSRVDVVREEEDMADVSNLNRMQEVQLRDKKMKERKGAQGGNSEMGFEEYEYYDVVLSSGFLAFGAHTGFLRGIEENFHARPNLSIDGGKFDSRTGRSKLKAIRGIMGTSSGAIVGSLLANSYSVDEIENILTMKRPVEHLRLSGFPWIIGGMYSMDKLVSYLRNHLPDTFEELARPFGVGVVDKKTKKYELITSGPLIEAVVASASVPFLFKPTTVPSIGSSNLSQDKRGRRYIDGGVVDRVGVSYWRKYCDSKEGRQRMEDFYRRQNFCGASSNKKVGVTPALVHIVTRSTKFSGNDSICNKEGKLVVVESPSANMRKTSLWNLGDFDDASASTFERTKCKLKENLKI